jgi:hypothetical protein
LDNTIEGSLKAHRELSVEASEAIEEQLSRTSKSKRQVSVKAMTVVPGLAQVDEDESQNLLFERDEYDKIKFIHQPLTALIEEKPHLYEAKKFMTAQQFQRVVSTINGDRIPPQRKRMRFLISAMVDYLRALHRCRYTSFKNVLDG